jgi:hypothetical protein
MTRFLRFIFPILSVGLLATGYFLLGLVWPAVGLLVFGILWIVGLALHWDWVPPLGLFAAFGAAALGLFFDPSPVFFIPAALCAFLAWDLAGFHSRLHLASPEDDTAALEKRHLSRLVVLVLAGGGLSTFALTLKMRPSFEWVVILMFFTIWGIGRMVNLLLSREG